MSTIHKREVSSGISTQGSGGTSQSRSWPEDGLDVARLLAGGWRPVPFQEFILKLHGRCNLACDHCYVYRAADRSWQDRPRAMSIETIRVSAARIAEHAAAHELPRLDVILHGGEPLLAGPRLIELTARELRQAAPAGCRVNIGVQTNGVLLTRSMLDLLAECDIGVSVSLDGTREAHDRHRRHRDGRGSHAEVMRGLRLLAGPYRRLYRGLLCTVDLANDPLATYEALVETEPPKVDLLLPHGTWAAPPPGLRPTGDGPTPYADWMIAVFDRWYRAAPRRTGIRFFEEIMNLVLGGRSRSACIGLSPAAMVVVDTDGTIQQADVLKTAFAGAPETGLHVARDSFDRALRHPGVVARQIGLAALCETCLSCPVRDVCGGGSYAHRYRPGHGYRNPSVYCRELEKIIRHISAEMRRDLAALTPARPIRRHRLPASDFAALAAGGGGRATVKLLQNAVLSKQLLRIRALNELTGALDTASFRLLARVQATAPQIVTELLRYPHVVAWAATCLRSLRTGEGDDGDLAHLGGIAAAAAIRAGADATATVPVRGGVVALPTLGCAHVGPPDFDGIARVLSAPDGAEISTEHGTVRLPSDPTADAPGWLGLRRLRADCDGRVLEIYLDDLDPFRGGWQLDPAPRLTEDAIRSWQRTLEGAWSILVRHHPHWAEAIAAGLTAIVPLARRGRHRGVSATSAEAPGAIALSPPGDALLLAESLVHEFQHVKLCAVMDMFALHTADDSRCFYAPWREDPRPLGGLIHGAYAYLGVTDFWGRQQQVANGDEAAYAKYLLALWREETWRTLGVIERSGRLTETGERFIAGMRAALEPWMDVPLPADSCAMAADTAADHALMWRLRHLRPALDAIDRLAAAWPRGEPEQMTATAALVLSDRGPGNRARRTELRHLRLRFPEKFQRLRARAENTDPSVRMREEADIAHVSGDFAAAIDGYRARLADDPQDIEAWSGLAVSARREYSDQGIGPLFTHPEVVMAVYRRIREHGKDAPDPVDLARWLAPALQRASREWSIPASHG